MREAGGSFDPRRSHHDMGGLPAGPVEASEHEYALWEKRVDAILSLLFKKGLMTVDEMRRNIESLGADAYDRMSYYGRWIEAGARTRAEPMPASDAVEARFRAGDRVSVREAYPLGHVRTPFYARGKSGVVERLCGFYPNPEERAYARSGLPKQPLYRVRFREADLWPDFAGEARDTVDIEIYQHWLEAAQ